ncbi:TrkH family potassium uptake protein [Roseobacter denitrificans]|nr:potassium transporter TrkG [Roseobacter denitrificans]
MLLLHGFIFLFLRNDSDGGIMTKSVTRKSGAEMVLQSARLSRVSLALAKHGVLLPLVFLPPTVWAASELAWGLVLALLAPAALGGGLSLAVARTALPKDLRQVEAIVVLALLFVLTPVLSIPAFMTLGMPPVDALFEGMSALTTTGLSVATNADTWPFAGHLLRSWMQWCGGLAMATAVLAMLIGPGVTARKLGKVNMDDGDLISSTRTHARQLLGAYAGITLVFGAAISASIGSVPEGLLLTLSAVSTGGFAYLPDSVASYAPMTQGLTISASLCGAVSLLAVALLCKRDWSNAWLTGSLQRMALWSMGCVLTLCICVWVLGGSGYYVHAWNLLSAISTAGYSIGAMPTEPVLLVFFIAVMAIGGDVGSTAGGIKLARFLTLMRTGQHAARGPRLPVNAVAPMREHGQVLKQSQLIALLALLLFYSVFVLSLWTLFLAHGHPPLPALFDAVSAFSTVGLSTGVIGADNPALLKIATTFAMLLGRLEFVAVLLLVLPRTWHIPHHRRK